VTKHRPYDMVCEPVYSSTTPSVAHKNCYNCRSANPSKDASDQIRPTDRHSRGAVCQSVSQVHCGRTDRAAEGSGKGELPDSQRVSTDG